MEIHLQPDIPYHSNRVHLYSKTEVYPVHRFEFWVHWHKSTSCDYVPTNFGACLEPSCRHKFQINCHDNPSLGSPINIACEVYMLMYPELPLLAWSQVNMRHWAMYQIINIGTSECYECPTMFSYNNSEVHVLLSIIQCVHVKADFSSINP